MRFVQVGGIQEQLDAGHIVLLTNMAYSAAGEPLNCNIFDVASHAAIELAADKLCFLTLDEVADMHLPNWLPISDAEALIDQHMASQDELSCSVGRRLRSDCLRLPDASGTCDSHLFLVAQQIFLLFCRE